MSTNFPVALDSLSNPSAGTAQDGGGNSALAHSKQHADLNDAMESVQAKLGIDGSTNPSSVDRKLALALYGATASGVTEISGPDNLRIVIADAAPSNSDGRPDGTIYIQRVA